MLSAAQQAQTAIAMPTCVPTPYVLGQEEFERSAFEKPVLFRNRPVQVRFPALVLSDEEELVDITPHAHACA